MKLTFLIIELVENTERNSKKKGVITCSENNKFYSRHADVISSDHRGYSCSSLDESSIITQDKRSAFLPSTDVAATVWTIESNGYKIQVMYVYSEERLGKKNVF